MTNPADDPRLTAYALGERDELTPSDRAEIEALLQRSPEARAAVDEIRALAGALEGELAAEEAPGLRPEQRETVLAGRAGGSDADITPLRRRPVWMPLAAAASLLLAAGLWYVTVPGVGPADDPTTPRSNDYVAVNEVRPASELPGGRKAGSALRPEAARELVAKPAGQLAAKPVAGEDQLFADAADAADEVDALVETEAESPFAYDFEGARTDGSLADADDARPVSAPVSAPKNAGAAGAPGPAEPGKNEASQIGSKEKKDGGEGQLAKSVQPKPSFGKVMGRRARTLNVGMPSVAEVSGIVPDKNIPVGGSYRRSTTPGTESYAAITDNAFTSPFDAPLSTFSIDVDTGAYANVRRFLNEGRLPPRDAVRIEELINYFDYEYAPPADGEAPFAVHVETGPAPWAPEHRLVRIGLKGMEIDRDERPAANLVFLLDVSGSMNSPDKLGLLQSSMGLLVDELDEGDRVAIVTYAGNARVALPATSGSDKATIRSALQSLNAGGSTHGSAGIQQAYDIAASQFIEGGVNRVVLATDGDFNVGVTNQGALEQLITDRARNGVFLTVLGFGTGNLKDATMEMLADKGNGNYAYIDSLDEGRRVLVDRVAGTLITIAKDVKIQVEFNPSRVGAYRLIGYENRVMAAQDFNDDRKDAGEIGAGHTVTALYEIAPPGTSLTPGIDDLKYQKTADAAVPTPTLTDSPELLTVKLRYKLPDEDTSTRLELPVVDDEVTLGAVSDDFRFAAAVAAFGMLLRDSPHKGGSDFELVVGLADEGRGEDLEGWRAEFIRLARAAASLKGQPVR